MLNVIVLRVIMLSVIELSVLLSVIVINVVMLIVMAPNNAYLVGHIFLVPPCTSGS